MKITKSFGVAQLFLFPVLVICFFTLGLSELVSVLLGVLLSLFFVGSSLWITEHFWDTYEGSFINIYIFSVLIRFLVVLTVFIVLLGTVKINEIHFTVSFIISYLYHSVTETILIHKFINRRSTDK